MKSMRFPKNIRKKAKIASDGLCAFCHRVRILNHHHIIPKSESGDNSFENCLPVCFNCHEFIKQNKIDPDIQKNIRNMWYKYVEWKITPEEKRLLRIESEKKIKPRPLKDDIHLMRSNFEDYIQDLLKENPDPIEREIKANRLIKSLFTNNLWLQLEIKNTTPSYIVTKLQKGSIFETKNENNEIQTFVCTKDMKIKIGPNKLKSVRIPCCALGKLEYIPKNQEIKMTQFVVPFDFTDECDLIEKYEKIWNADKKGLKKLKCFTEIETKRPFDF